MPGLGGKNGGGPMPMPGLGGPNGGIMPRGSISFKSQSMRKWAHLEAAVGRKRGARQAVHRHSWRPGRRAMESVSGTLAGERDSLGSLVWRTKRIAGWWVEGGLTHVHSKLVVMTSGQVNADSQTQPSKTRPGRVDTRGYTGKRRHGRGHDISRRISH